MFPVLAFKWKVVEDNKLVEAPLDERAAEKLGLELELEQKCLRIVFHLLPMALWFLLSLRSKTFPMGCGAMTRGTSEGHGLI